MLRSRGIRARARSPRRSWNRKIAEEAATYLTRKAAYLDYPTALEHGWPIATGIIELDRMMAPSA